LFYLTLEIPVREPNSLVPRDERLARRVVPGSVFEDLANGLIKKRKAGAASGA
jgi:hypothetical protein